MVQHFTKSWFNILSAHGSIYASLWLDPKTKCWYTVSPSYCVNFIVAMFWRNIEFIFNGVYFAFILIIRNRLLNFKVRVFFLRFCVALILHDQIHTKFCNIPFKLQFFSFHSKTNEKKSLFLNSLRFHFLKIPKYFFFFLKLMHFL